MSYLLIRIIIDEKDLSYLFRDFDMIFIYKRKSHNVNLNSQNIDKNTKYHVKNKNNIKFNELKWIIYMHYPLTWNIINMEEKWTYPN